MSPVPRFRVFSDGFAAVLPRRPDPILPKNPAMGGSSYALYSRISKAQSLEICVLAFLGSATWGSQLNYIIVTAATIRKLRGPSCSPKAPNYQKYLKIEKIGENREK